MKIFSMIILIILTSIAITLLGIKLFDLEGTDLRIFCLIIGIINGGLIGNFFGKK